jgi:phosphoserine phosphatase RsbU/P
VRILVVDDDEVIRHFLCRRMTELGHEAWNAADGDSALESALSHNVDVVISDWQMPGFDGLELCRRIRKARSERYVYFILVTVHGSPGVHEEAIREGVDDYLTKPIDAANLAMRVFVAQRILTFHRQIRRLQSLLPICSYCHKVRNDRDYWQQIEDYVGNLTGADLTHGICPDCYEREVKRLREETP